MAKRRTTPPEVLVWYSPTAIHFGIRAAARRPSRARDARRSRSHPSDDHILIFLSTFNDGRQALVFGVNPLGVQMDGALVEGSRAARRRLQRPDQRPRERPT